jgi:ubiquitin-protein ligase
VEAIDQVVGCLGIHSPTTQGYDLLYCLQSRADMSCPTEPNPDDAVEAKIADQYRQDRAGFEKEARDWTKRYASKK